VVFGIKGVIHAEIVRITIKLQNWTVPRAAIMQARSTARHAMVDCLARKDMDMAEELEH